MPARNTIQVRRGYSMGYSGAIIGSTPLSGNTWTGGVQLAEGELGYEINTGRFKIGRRNASGVLITWENLDYAGGGGLGGGVIPGSGIGILVNASGDDTIYSILTNDANDTNISITSGNIKDIIPSATGFYYKLGLADSLSNIENIEISGILNTYNLVSSGYMSANYLMSITDFETASPGILSIGEFTSLQHINWTIDQSGSANFSNLSVNDTSVSLNGHTHTASNITDFNSSVSGLLPTIANSGNNRILTSTGSSVGVNAEEGLTFDGSTLNVAGLPDNDPSSWGPGIITAGITNGPTTIYLHSYTSNSNFDGGNWGGGVIHLFTADSATSSTPTLTITPFGFVFGDSTVQNTAWTGSVTSSQVTDFNSSVSGLLPIKNIVAGSNIQITNGNGLAGDPTIALSGDVSGLTSLIIDNIKIDNDIIYYNNIARIDLTNNETAINNTGGDIDFRIEGGTNPNLVFIDASADKVGIGTASPGHTLDVNGSGNFTGNLIVGGDLTVNGTTVTANVTTMEVEDPIIALGRASGTVITDTNYDRGLALIRNATTTAFMGWDSSASEFVILSSGTTSDNGNTYTAGAYGQLHIGGLEASGLIKGRTLESTVTSPTAPIVVASTGTVSNLSSDYLDGQHGSYYLNWNNFSNIPDPTVTVTISGDVAGTGTYTWTNLSGNLSLGIQATIQADSVALGTDTTGNYVGSVAVSGTGLSISNTGSEGGTFTVSSNATPANISSTIVSRDSSGNFTASTITATLSGTATNALNIEVDTSSSNTNHIIFVNGTDGNLKPSVNSNLKFNAVDNILLGDDATTPTTKIEYFILDGGTP